jgi:hypothetical protein
MLQENVAAGQQLSQKGCAPANRGQSASGQKKPLGIPRLSWQVYKEDLSHRNG